MEQWEERLTCRDFLLKPELLRAISDLGFEHPSEGRPIVSMSRPKLMISTTGVYPPGYPWYRCPLSGKVWYG
jgi:hypothetical protein